MEAIMKSERFDNPLLTEHATVMTEGLKPRRSIVFASWSGGEYGSVGATEWLEVRTAFIILITAFSSSVLLIKLLVLANFVFLKTYL